MKSTFFVTFPLVVTYGLAFGQNIDQDKSGPPATPQERGDSWNPLAELLGLKEEKHNEGQGDTLSELFDRHNSEMNKAMKEHQDAMDEAMEEHQKVLDTVFDGIRPVMDTMHRGAMAQHQSLMQSGMNAHLKDLANFDKDWDKFDRDMNDMFKVFDKHLEEVSAPYEVPPNPTMLRGQTVKEERPIVGTDEKKGEKDESAKNKTGLPVFHPNKTSSAPVAEGEYRLPALINHIMDGFKPVINDIQKEVQDRINSTYQTAVNQTQEKGLTVENTTNLDEGSNSGLFSTFTHNVVDSVAELSKLWSDLIPEDKETTDGQQNNPGWAPGVNPMFLNSLDKKLRIAYVLHALENVLMARMTRVSFTDTSADLENLYNLGFNEIDLKGAEDKVIVNLIENKAEAPIGLVWTKEPWEVYNIKADSVDKIDVLDNVVEVVSGRLLSYLDQAKRQEEEVQRKMDVDKYIAKQLRSEFKIKHVDDDYEWYEWVTVGLIAITSSLLLIVAMFMVVRRHHRSRSVKLDTEGAVPKGQNGFANENLSNKYKEKIKTIFVNLK